MSEEHEVTDPSAFEKRSFGKMVLFFIVTFGIYGLYWFHQVNKQLENGLDADYNATMQTVGLFIPIYNLVAIWRFCNTAATVVDDQDGTIVFVLYIFVAPVAVYLIQDGINAIAE